MIDTTGYMLLSWERSQERNICAVVLILASPGAAFRRRRSTAAFRRRRSGAAFRGGVGP
jgi:hypothetical protein